PAGRSLRPRGRADAGEPGRPDAAGGPGRRRLRGRARRRLRLSGVPAGVRRGRQPLQPARAALADEPADLRTRRRPAGVYARPPPDPLTVGDEGPGHAAPPRTPP